MSDSCRTSQTRACRTGGRQPGIIREWHTADHAPRKNSIRIPPGHSGGPWSHEELHAMILQRLDEARATGIRNFRRGNLYLNPGDEKGRIVTREGRQPLPDMDVPHPYRSTADENGV